MAGFISLKDAKAVGKGNIIIKVVSLGELQKGVSKTSGDPWQKQGAVIKDASLTETLTLWGDDIGRLMAGKCYKLESPYWKEYKGENQISLGKYCTVTECSESDLLGQQTMPTEASAPAQGVDFKKLNEQANADEALRQKQQEIQNQLDLLQMPSGKMIIFVHEQAKLLLQIRREVEDEMSKYSKAPPVGAEVGMIVSKIYDEIRKDPPESWK